MTSTRALTVVFLVVLVQTVADFSTSRVMASTQDQDILPDDVVILRDSVQTTLPAASLVPGDLAQISMGQKVPQTSS